MARSCWVNKLATLSVISVILEKHVHLPCYETCCYSSHLLICFILSLFRVHLNGSLCTYWTFRTNQFYNQSVSRGERPRSYQLLWKIHRQASIKSISAHMPSPWGAIRNIWTEFPRIHQACGNTIDFKSCFRMADLTGGSLLPLCWHKFTSTMGLPRSKCGPRLIIGYPASLMTCVTWHYDRERWWLADALDLALYLGHQHGHLWVVYGAEKMWSGPCQ